MRTSRTGLVSELTRTTADDFLVASHSPAILSPITFRDINWGAIQVIDTLKGLTVRATVGFLKVVRSSSGWLLDNKVTDWHCPSGGGH